MKRRFGLTLLCLLSIWPHTVYGQDATRRAKAQLQKAKQADKLAAVGLEWNQSKSLIFASVERMKVQQVKIKANQKITGEALDRIASKIDAVHILMEEDGAILLVLTNDIGDIVGRIEVLNNRVEKVEGRLAKSVLSLVETSKGLNDVQADLDIVSCMLCQLSCELNELNNYILIGQIFSILIGVGIGVSVSGGATTVAGRGFVGAFPF